MATTIEVVSTILLKLLQAAPTIIQTVENVRPMAARLVDAIQGKTELSEEEIAQLQAGVDALLDEAMTPLPPAQPGDPDYRQS